MATYRHPSDQPRLPEELRERADLSEIDALGGGLRELPPWLGELPGLRRLQVTLAEGAGPGSLDGLAAATGLHTLRLHLPGEGPALLPDLGALGSLRSLWLQGRALRALPEGVARLPLLEELCLCECSIHAPPAGFGALSSLRVLTLQDLPLEALPEEIDGLSALTGLRLRNTRIRLLPDALGRLDRLSTLSVTCLGQPSRLAELPRSLGALRWLRELDLSGNDLREIPVELALLDELVSLNLSGNPLRELPDELAALRLQTLDLRDTALPRLPACVSWMPTLRRLDANYLHLDGDVHRQLQGLDPERAGVAPARPAYTASPAPLCPAVRAECDRLGVGLAEPPGEPLSWAIGGVDCPVPRAVRQLIEAEWPEDVVQTEELEEAEDESEVGRLGPTAWDALGPYRLTCHAPWVAFCTDDSSFDFWVLRLDDPDPTDPTVHRFEQGDWPVVDVDGPGLRLSAFLAGLRRV